MDINWKKFYDWSVVDVKHPYLLTNGKRSVYCVDVTFKYHGVLQTKFFVGHDRMLVTGDKLARQTAINFYLRMRKRKIKEK